MGLTFIHYLNGELDKTIEYANKTFDIYSDFNSLLRPIILRAYNRNKDYLNAKDIGNDYLNKYDNKPLILLEIAKAHLGLNENDKANEYLTKLLGIWEDADEEYIYYQEAKKLWKELNMEKAAVA